MFIIYGLIFSGCPFSSCIIYNVILQSTSFRFMYFTVVMLRSALVEANHPCAADRMFNNNIRCTYFYIINAATFNFLGNL